MKPHLFIQKSKSLLVLVSFFILGYSSKAQSVDTCSNMKALKYLCMMIDGRMKLPDGDVLQQYTPGAANTSIKDPIPKPTFLYEKKIYEAACVDIYNDSREVMKAKIQHMWIKLNDRLICNGLNFDVIHGNVIKYAVNTKFDAFIDDVAEWKVGFNKVDKGDGRTVLDYIQYHMQRNAGTEVALRLQSYYDTIRKAGGKHAAEL